MEVDEEPILMGCRKKMGLEYDLFFALRMCTDREDQVSREPIGGEPPV
jgi:hypothetical protein